VGRDGSPGRVEASEDLHSVILNIDEGMAGGALMYVFISPAQKKGMSVLRHEARDDEFRIIISERLQRPNRMLKGFVTFSCAELRRLKDNDGLLLYYVTDTDLQGLPHHADVLATPLGGTPAQKRLQRSRLLDLLRHRMQSHEAFGGVFSEFASVRPAPSGASGPQG
jgi:hypothetical protein